jgi:2-amino-4-hydroxy-6-hydroxymethyldihydropteridine diphosphokinase
VAALVYLGIGSNLGQREENCLKAIELLGKKGIIIIKRSSLYRTEPWGVREQPDFINMVVEAETELSPDDLLRVIKEIEREMGRVETFRWGPRIIDIDILLYNDMVYEGPELRIPHPLMHEREFVLIPLCEIAPEKIHPVLKRTMNELRQGLQRP